MMKQTISLGALTFAAILTLAVATTSNTPESLVKAVPCSNEIDGQCIKWLLSKTLGLGVVGLSFLLKVPIIRNMLKQGSADGLTLDSLYLDLISYACAASYNMLIAAPLSTYAETIIIGLQIFAMIALTWKFNKVSFTQRATFTAAAAVFVGIVCVLPEQYWPVLMAVCTFMAIGSRITQITANFKNKHTGVLSLVSVLMQVSGCLVRIFTTLAEVDDIAVLGSYIVAFALNLTICIQIGLFWNNTAKLQAGKTQQPGPIEKQKVA